MDTDKNVDVEVTYPFPDSPSIMLWRDGEYLTEFYWTGNVNDHGAIREAVLKKLHGIDMRQRG